MKQISDKTYQALKSEIDRLENKKWKPKWDEDYWFVDGVGVNDTSTWNDNDYDNWRYDQGNCFKTEEEAEHHLKVLNAQAKIRNSSEFHPDWSDRDQYKWIVYYNHDHNKLDYVRWIVYQYPALAYYATSEEAEQAMTDLEEEYLLVLGVKDEK